MSESKSVVAKVTILSTVLFVLTGCNPSLTRRCIDENQLHESIHKVNAGDAKFDCQIGMMYLALALRHKYPKKIFFTDKEMDLITEKCILKSKSYE